MQALVLTSGGLDSAVALEWALDQGYTVQGLTFDYHLRPEAERRAVEAQFDDLDESKVIAVELPWLREAEDQPRLHPALEHAPEGYIPARNVIFYATAAHHAEVLGIRDVVGGHNGGDGDDFPDATPRYFRDLQDLLNRGLFAGDIEIHLPLQDRSKADVVRLGHDLGVDLAGTWSCNEDGDLHCGTCPSCTERAEAFAEAGLQDPIKYETSPEVER